MLNAQEALGYTQRADKIAKESYTAELQIYMDDTASPVIQKVAEKGKRYTTLYVPHTFGVTDVADELRANGYKIMIRNARFIYVSW